MQQSKFQHLLSALIVAGPLDRQARSVEHHDRCYVMALKEFYTVDTELDISERKKE